MFVSMCICAWMCIIMFVCAVYSSLLFVFEEERGGLDMYVFIACVFVCIMFMYVCVCVCVCVCLCDQQHVFVPPGIYTIVC